MLKIKEVYYWINLPSLAMVPCEFNESSAIYSETRKKRISNIKNSYPNTVEEKLEISK